MAEYSATVPVVFYRPNEKKLTVSEATFCSLYQSLVPFFGCQTVPV